MLDEEDEELLDEPVLEVPDRREEAVERRDDARLELERMLPVSDLAVGVPG